jgi:hypothetical protein
MRDTLTLACARTHTRAHTHARARAHTHTRARAHTHTHTNAYTRTHESVSTSRAGTQQWCTSVAYTLASAPLFRQTYRDLVCRLSPCSHPTTHVMLSAVLDCSVKGRTRVVHRALAGGARRRSRSARLRRRTLFPRSSSVVTLTLQSPRRLKRCVVLESFQLHTVLCCVVCVCVCVCVCGYC